MRFFKLFKWLDHHRYLFEEFTYAKTCSEDDDGGDDLHLVGQEKIQISFVEFLCRRDIEEREQQQEYAEAWIIPSEDIHECDEEGKATKCSIENFGHENW